MFIASVLIGSGQAAAAPVALVREVLLRVVVIAKRRAPLGYAAVHRTMMPPAESK